VTTRKTERTSSRDLSIIMSKEVVFVKEGRLRRGIGWVVGCRGKVKDAARQLVPTAFCFVLFGLRRSWKVPPSLV
jgi:hypothetical protein